MVEQSVRPEALSLEAKVGQLFHVGIGPGYLQTDAGWPDEDMRRVVEELQPGAVRVYGMQEATPHFLAQCTNRIHAWATDTDHGVPPLVSADCEYGIVDVVRYGARAYPSLLGRTATGDPALARDVAGAVAREMVSTGLTMTHQPVADVNTNPKNPIIGVRSSGTDPETVAEYATALLEGVHDESQVAVAKHFPGHGDTESDSHHDLPHVTYDRETLMDVHVRAFERLIEAGVDCLMTAHVVVDCLDSERPATLSRPVLTDFLRSDLGFDGVVVTDSMRMNAIADDYDLGEAAVAAIAAGADLVLTGLASADALFDARDAVVDAVESGRLPESRIDDSVERILELKETYDLRDRREADPLEALATAHRDDHEALAREVYGRSFTVVGDGPLPLTETTSVLLTGSRGTRDLEPHFRDAFGDVVQLSLGTAAPGEGGSEPTLAPDSVDDALATLDSLVDAVDVAVVPTFTRDAFPEGQRAVVEALAADLPVVVVSLGLPNERPHLPEGVAYVATYAQERLGRPSPLPDAACETLVETLQRLPPETQSHALLE